MVREAILARRRDVPVCRGPTQDIATGVLDMPDFPVGRAHACASHPRSLAARLANVLLEAVHVLYILLRCMQSALIVLQYPVKVPKI